MSNTLRIYRSSTKGDPDMGRPPLSYNEDMYLTAFIGYGGHSTQFTIGNHFCTLDPNQVKDLIITLQNRLECKEGYSATDWGECKEILPLEEMGQ